MAVVATATSEAQSVPTRAAGLFAAGTVIAALIMCLRIASFCFEFSQTFDEQAHIACGMEWLDKGVYQYESAHPPLGRIAAAMGPYLLGERSHGLPDATVEGNAILGEGSHYRRTLGASRLGELPFAVLALAGVWVWARHYFGPSAAFFAALLFSLLPPVLANSGLATTDIAVTAACVWALYAFTRLLDDPSWKKSVALGIWCGIALISKFSAVPFLACGFLAIWAVYAFCSRPAAHASIAGKPKLVRLLALSSIVAALAVWACFRFTFGPLFTEHELLTRNAHVPQKLLQPGWAHTAVTTIPLPAGRFFRGFGQVWMHNQTGHGSYLLGDMRQTGWWYFFPVVLAVKTPLGFLVLALSGAAGLLLSLRRREWLPAAPAVAALSILLVCLTSRIDLGVRHILPIYPLLSIAAGVYVANSIRQFRSVPLALVLVCLIWCGVDSARAHPDYLAWFNQIASAHPEHFRIDADLDWGQDLGHLSARLQELHAPSVALSYFGTADLSRFSLPPFSARSCEGPLSGYVAVSITNLYYKSLTCPARFQMLQRRKPTEVVGKSIFLYYFPSQ